jgi:hypothetical protein
MSLAIEVSKEDEGSKDPKQFLSKDQGKSLSKDQSQFLSKERALDGWW